LSVGFTVIQFNSAASDAITEPSQHSSITTNGSSAAATKTTRPNHRSASSSTSGAAILVKATVHYLTSATIAGVTESASPKGDYESQPHPPTSASRTTRFQIVAGKSYSFTPRPKLSSEPPNMAPSVVSQLSSFRARSLNVYVVVFDSDGKLTVSTFSIKCRRSLIGNIKSLLGCFAIPATSSLFQTKQVHLIVSTVGLESYCTSASGTFNAAHHPCVTSPSYHLLTCGLTCVKINFHAPIIVSNICGTFDREMIF
jgi:hypothetical protein